MGGAGRTSHHPPLGGCVSLSEMGSASLLYQLGGPRGRLWGLQERWGWRDWLCARRIGAFPAPGRRTRGGARALPSRAGGPFAGAGEGRCSLGPSSRENAAAGFSPLATGRRGAGGLLVPGYLGGGRGGRAGENGRFYRRRPPSSLPPPRAPLGRGPPWTGLAETRLEAGRRGGEGERGCGPPAPVVARPRRAWGPGGGERAAVDPPLSLMKFKFV